MSRKKERRATDEAALALSGVETTLRLIERLSLGDRGDSGNWISIAELAGKGKQYAEELRQALLTIQFHASHI